MEAKELRIGNWIDYERTSHLVTGIKNNFIWSRWSKQTSEEDDYFDYVENHKGIPISPEILEKAGFEKTIDEDGGEVFRKGEFEIEYYILSAADTGFYYSNNTSKETFLQYVHQLQNLYFALTGEDISLQL